MTPQEWHVQSMGNILQRVVRPVDVQPEQNYYQIGIRSHGIGIFDKEAVSGLELGDKRVFWVEPNCFIVNIVFAWEQAIAVTKQEDEGKIASHRFPMFRPRNNLSDVHYLNYYFRTPRGKHLLGLASPGGAGRNKTLGQGEFDRLDLALPPLPEQKKIADILSTWDAAIETTAKLLANAESQKRALMQQLLTGKRRLKGFEGKWKRKYFRDVVDVDKSSLGSNTPDDFRFRYISLSEVSTGTILGVLPELRFKDAPSRARRKLEEGDILMATVRPNLQAFARVDQAHADCIASTGFAVLSAKQGFDASYVYHYLFSEHATEQIDALVVGSNYPAINSSDVKGLSIHIPALDEQRAISDVLNATEKLIAHYEAQQTSLRAEKRALMQQLLTGKRRVKL